MEKWASGTVREGRNNNTTTIYNDHIVSLLIHYLGGCTDTILGIEILNRVESSLGFSNGMLLAFCPITNNRATLLHVASQVRSPASKVSQNYRSTQPFSALETHTKTFHNSDFFSLSFGSYTREYVSIIESRIERKSYWYTEFIYRILLYFYQCCNKPIDLLIFPRQEWFDVKKCQRWKKFTNHRHVVFFSFFFIMSNRILGELTAKAERYFTKNNRVKCKFTKRDAL